MISLVLDVEKKGFLVKKNVLLYNGKEVRVPKELEADVAALPPGKIEAGCEYRPGGMVLSQLGGRTVTIPPYEAPPVVRQEDPVTRRALDEMGETALPSLAHELFRAMETMIGRDERDRAARLFPLLLDAAKRNPSMVVDPPSVAAMRRELPKAARAENAEIWMRWLVEHKETGAPEYLVEDVDPSRWPVELVVRGLHWHIARRRDTPELHASVAMVRARAPGHPALAAADALLAELAVEKEKAAARAEVQRRERLQALMDQPAHVESIEMGFGISLPRGIALAWRRRDPRVSLLRELTLRALLDEAGRIREAHLAEDAAPAFLPLSRENGATIGLYLTHTRPSGDYAVLRVGEHPELVANASADWLP